MVDTKQFSDAVWLGNLAIVESMITDGADVNATDGPRYPPLHLAIEQLWIEIVRCLIAAGADVNCPRADGWTALMQAIDVESDSAQQAGAMDSEASMELTELLLEVGAAPTAEAIELAEKYGNQKAAALLRRYGNGQDA